MKHLDISREIAGLASYATQPLAAEPLVRKHVQAELEQRFLAHARKVALAKVGRRVEAVPRDSETNVRARAAVARTLARALGKVKRQAIALLRQQGELKKVWSDEAREASAEVRRKKSGEIKDKAGTPYDVTRETREGRHQYFVTTKSGVGVGNAHLGIGNKRVMSVGVYPEYQRKGVASALYDHIEGDLGYKLEQNWADTPDGLAFWQSRLGKAVDDSDLPTKIARQLDLAAVVDAMGEVADDLSEAAVAAAQHTVNSLDLGDDEELTNRVNDKAVAIARRQAAMLVGRRWDEDGYLVPVKNPEYQIDETTRDGIRQLIADGLEQNIGTNAIAKSINDDFIVSEKRAGLIARSEVARVNSLSVLDSLFSARDDAGVNVKKVWLTAGDDLVDDVCQENEDAGPIDLEDDFPSGDDAPLAHPFCRCTLTNMVYD